MSAADDLSTRVDDLFDRAAEVPPEARSAWLRRACAGDDALRSRLEALLEADREAGSFLARPFGSVADDDPPTVRTGQRVGAYRLLRHLASGGMGTVFVATRDDQVFERLVAIKVLDRHVRHDELRRRFDLERRILASLEHPSIARLYDAGELPDGQPYLVMELVDGVSIDRYCTEHGCDLDEILALCLAILKALAHAHQSLVIHRDLKPNNILVTADGHPKLLDFGIAKLLPDGNHGDDGRGSGLATEAGPQPRTPAFAAPEQIHGGNVATSTDTYAVGLLLYELLCGRGPFVAPSVRTAPAAASEVTLWSDAAPAPGVTPNRLRGDLDAVLQKAVALDPRDRYATADALAEDLSAIREHRPVRARRASPWLLLGKLVRRNRLAAASAGFASLTLLVLLVATTLQSGRVARERDAARLAQAEAEHESRRAEQILDLLTRTFASADPYSSGSDPDLPVRQVLERADRSAAELAPFPLTQAAYFHVLGRLRLNLGMAAESEPLLREALRIRRARLPVGDPRTLETYDLLVGVLLESGALEDAEHLARQGLADHAVAGGKERVAAALRGSLAVAMARQGGIEQALAMNERSVKRLRAMGPAAAAELIDAIHNRGFLAFSAGDYALARTAYAESIALRRRHEAQPSAVLAKSLGDLGTSLWHLGELAEADAAFREALPIQIRHLGAEHPEVARTLNNLGGLEDQLGRPLDAAVSHCRALALRRQRYGPVHETVGRSLNNLAHALSKAGDRRLAMAFFLRAEEVWQDCCPSHHRDLASTRSNRAKIAGLEDDYETAASLLESAIQLGEAAYGADHPAVGDYYAGLAWVRLMEHRPAQAEDLATRARAVYRVRLDSDHGRVRYADLLIAAAHSALGDGDEAAAGFEAALPTVATAFPRSSVLRKALLLLRSHGARWGLPPALESFRADMEDARLAPAAVDLSHLVDGCSIDPSPSDRGTVIAAASVR